MHPGHSLEPLESRIAPAAAINATTAVFTDVDGDLVTIKFSKPIAQTVLYASNIFVGTSITGAEQLLRIDLFNVTPAAAAGVNITFTAVPRDVTGDGVKDGDGKVNVGEIRAVGKDLGIVTIPGDLARIEAGSGDVDTAPTALVALTVHSMGEYGLSTGAASLDSRLSGKVGKIATTGNVRDVSITVGVLGNFFPIGALSIGGSLIGGDLSGSGFISAGALGSASIRGDIVGGDGSFSGRIIVGGKLGSLTVGGSILGGGGSSSGTVRAAELGTAAIGQDVAGGVRTSTESALSSGVIEILGKAGNITVGGSLIGMEAEGAGRIQIGGDAGFIRIGGDVLGGPYDSALALGSGRIEAGGKIAGVSVGGSLIGDNADKSGSIFALGRLGPVTIGGNVLGLEGDSSGSIGTDARIDSIRIGGTVRGETGAFSGSITSAGEIGSVAIAHDLIGDLGEGSGSIRAGKVASIVIGGSVIGGIDPNPNDFTNEAHASGRIDVDDLGTVKIGGNLIGHASGSGGIEATSIARVEIGGSILGGEVEVSGFIVGSDSIGVVIVGGDVRSGFHDETGFIFAGGGVNPASIGSVTIGGSLRGDFNSGTDFAGLIQATGTLGVVKIGGSVFGGYAGDKSGYIEGALGIKSVTIAGSLVGRPGNDSGEITTGGTLGTVKIGGDIRGGGSEGAAITNTGTIIAKQITSLTVGGSIFSGHQPAAGALTRSGSVHADQKFGAFVVHGSLVGNESLPVLITAGGDAPIAPTIARPEIAIGSFTVGGNVDHTFILAGYNRSGIGVSADASVGAVRVGGDWIGSYLSAGVEPGGDLIFGTPDDRLLPAGADFGGGPVRDNLSVSKIASIVIGGQIKSGQNDGLPFDGNQTYGFVAQQIGSFKYDAIVAPLTPGANNDTFALGRARPLGASRSSLNAGGFAMHVFEV
jgi:hypothetical protein